MNLRIIKISVLAIGITPMCANATNASLYIADKEYIKYRLQLVQEALNDPAVKERLEKAESIGEYEEQVKSEIENKLKKYRKENGLDEDGAKKK